jgi:hypothetical protein
MLQFCFLLRKVKLGSRGILLGVFRGLFILGAGITLAQTDVGRFKVPDIDENGLLKSLMTGESAKMYLGKPMEIQKLVIEFYKEDGITVNIRVTSPFCTYDTGTNIATSDNKINIDGDGFHIEGVGYVFESSSSQMEIRSNVKVIFKNMNIKPPRPNPETYP